MLRNSLYLLTLMACLSGCITTSKSKLPVTKPLSITEEGGKVSSDVKEKVWVEAETSKIWVNPHVDENGDMIDGHYKYTIVTPGHWAVKDRGRE